MPEVEKEENSVTVGLKEWFVYANAIVMSLANGPVTVKARGRLGIEKAAGVLASLVQKYPAMMVSITISIGEYKKEDKVYRIPYLVATVTTVS